MSIKSQNVRKNKSIHYYENQVTFPEEDYNWELAVYRRWEKKKARKK